MYKEEIKETTIDSIIDLTIENIKNHNNAQITYDRIAIKKKLKEIIKIKKGW